MVAKLLVLLAITLPLPAFAAISITCGTNPNNNDGTFETEVLTVSSADDDFTGPAGKQWFLEIAGKEIQGTQAKAKFERNSKGQVTNLRIRVQNKMEYLVSNPYRDYPTLEVFTSGGVSGRTRTATYNCVAAID